MNTDIKKVMVKAIAMANDMGADQSDLIVSTGESFSISAQDGKIDKYKVSGAKVLGIRSIKNERVGLSYTEDLGDDSLKIAVSKSLENAEASEPRPYEIIRAEKKEDLKPSAFQADKTSIDEKINFTLDLEAKVKGKDKRVASAPYNGFSETTSETYYMNSLNRFNYESEYYLHCYTSALVKEGADNSMHYQGNLARNFKDLDADFCVNESVEHASQWLKAESLPTKSYDLIFETNAFESLWSCFGGIFSAKDALDKVNPFGDRLGQKVMSEHINLWDRPKYQDAFFVSNFDSEGFEQSDLCLISAGDLKNFYHNTATANYFNVDSNARAARGAKSSLNVAGTNLVFEAGKTKEEELTMGDYLEVISMQGLHSGASAYSGEFSFAASGYLCRDGKRVKPIKGVTVSGNFYQMLRDLKLAGDKVYSSDGRDFFAPLFRFSNISVGGD